MAMGRFFQCPKIQTRRWRAGDVEHVSKTLEARGRGRASGKEPNRRVISHRGKNPEACVIYTIYNSLRKFNQITVLIAKLDSSCYQPTNTTPLPSVLHVRLESKSHENLFVLVVRD